jgi:hypothetical protein
MFTQIMGYLIFLVRPKLEAFITQVEELFAFADFHWMDPSLLQLEMMRRHLCGR